MTDRESLMEARSRDAVNPRYRFFVRPGEAFEAVPWVVVDRQIEAVVAEFEWRKDARAFVKERNSKHGIDCGCVACRRAASGARRSRRAASPAAARAYDRDYKRRTRAAG